MIPLFIFTGGGPTQDAFDGVVVTLVFLPIAIAIAGLVVPRRFGAPWPTAVIASLVGLVAGAALTFASYPLISAFWGWVYGAW